MSSPKYMINKCTPVYLNKILKNISQNFRKLSLNIEVFTKILIFIFVTFIYAYTFTYDIYKFLNTLKLDNEKKTKRQYNG
jgi:hypothetical protein